ncbi:protein of unknown function [Candidatus Nitrotoga arctica]|uniref:Uncharacterized protein n=1 Tax=Candidatus Nitrotoga arctica TaxID=453162 RepID=A0ABN8AN40_9PROT|nr:protein of unknown function [Candidatus Nitrotoga arctica]
MLTQIVTEFFHNDQTQDVTLKMYLLTVCTLSHDIKAQDKWRNRYEFIGKL